MIALSVLVPALASAQIIRNQAPAAPNLQIQFNGTISTTVMLTITGGGPTTLAGTTTAIAPARAQGTIDFGSFSTLQPLAATNARRFRTTGGTPGAVIAATLVATVLYNGNPTASITVARKVVAAGLPDVPLANLRVSSPMLAVWSAGTNGTMVPNAGFAGIDVCRMAGDATCVNDKPYTHDLAVFLPDTQVSGPFSTTVVYSSTSP